MFIVIIISSFVYVSSIKVIKDETNKGYMASLRQMQQSVDNILYNIQTISVEISLDERINNIVNLKEQLNPYDRIEVVKIIEDLKKYKLANSFIKNIYIYVKNNNCIISSSAKYEPEDFFNLYYKDYNIQYTQWKSVFSDKHYQEYLTIPSISSDYSITNNITFMQTIPMTKRDSNDSTLVIEINEDAIKNSMKGLQWVSDADTIIKDKNNNILVSTKKINISKMLNFNMLNKEQDSFTKNINNQNLIISYISSKITDLKYISAVPESIFLQKAKHVFNVFLISTLSSILIGGILAYLLAKRNYIPIDKIINIIGNKKDKQNKYEYNEYDFIEKSIVDIIKDKEKIYNKLNQQNDILKNNLLIKLIKGRINENIQLDEVCQSYDIKLNDKYYFLALFYIEDFTSLYINPDDSEIISSKTTENVYYTIKNVFETLLNKRYNCYITLVDDMPVCLINTDIIMGKKERDDFYILINEAKDIAEKKYNIYLTIAISDVHATIKGISIAYQEAVDTIEYKLLIGINKVIKYEDVYTLNDDYKNDNDYNKKEQQFRNFINAGDYKSSTIVLSEMFETYFEKNKISIQIAKCRMFGLINIMLNIIGEVNSSNDNKYIESLNIANELFKCKTIYDLENKMIYILDKMDSYFETKKLYEKNTIIEEIFNYINENYSNEDISVSMVADRFNMNIVNLSKLFKKHSGIGMLDYINKLRIDKAKEIIRNENLSINEISTRVGYFNVAAFIRVFKKYEGVTPGKYKENLC